LATRLLSFRIQSHARETALPESVVHGLAATLFVLLGVAAAVFTLIFSLMKLGGSSYPWIDVPAPALPFFQIVDQRGSGTAGPNCHDEPTLPTADLFFRHF
jgi:hypothetical protein